MDGTVAEMPENGKNGKILGVAIVQRGENPEQQVINMVRTLKSGNAAGLDGVTGKRAGCNHS